MNIYHMIRNRLKFQNFLFNEKKFEVHKMNHLYKLELEVEMSSPIYFF